MNRPLQKFISKALLLAGLGGSLGGPITAQSSQEKEDDPSTVEKAPQEEFRFYDNNLPGVYAKHYDLRAELLAENDPEERQKNVEFLQEYDAMAKRFNLKEPPPLLRAEDPQAQITDLAASMLLSGGGKAVRLSTRIPNEITTDMLLGIIAHELSHIKHNDNFESKLDKVIRNELRADREAAGKKGICDVVTYAGALDITFDAGVDEYEQAQNNYLQVIKKTMIDDFRALANFSAAGGNVFLLSDDVNTNINTISRNINNSLQYQPSQVKRELNSDVAALYGRFMTALTTDGPTPQVLNAADSQIDGLIAKLAARQLNYEQFFEVVNTQGDKPHVSLDSRSLQLQALHDRGPKACRGDISDGSGSGGHQR